MHGPLDDRVIAITLEELKKTPRVVGVAGGDRKVEAIRACLKGSLVNVLVTDKFTAEKLLKSEEFLNPQSMRGERNVAVFRQDDRHHRSE